MNYRLERRLRRAKRNMADVIDDAGEAYETFRDEMGRRAAQAWDDREEYLDDVMALAQDAGDVVYQRFRSDPVGTIIIGGVAVWLLGKCLKR